MAKNTIFYSRRSKNFSFEQFLRAEIYGGAADYRRFTTLDYNMQSFLGVGGDGILSGWEVQISKTPYLSSETSYSSGSSAYLPRLIVTPGKGVINSYFSESPYEIKYRSEEVEGDIEVEVLPFQDVDADEEDDPLVKVVNPYNYELVLDPVIENGHYFVFAELPSDQLPYPKMEDFPERAGPFPNVANYATRAEYVIAVQEWNDSIQEIHSYEWEDNDENHFTEVQFSVSTTYIGSPNKILLAEVVIRDYEIVSIDTSEVNNLDS